MKKRFLSVIAVIIVLFTLVGCNSEITYLFAAGEKESMLALQIAVDKNEKSLLEGSAAPCNLSSALFSGAQPQNWTIDFYIETLITGLPGFDTVFSKEAVSEDTERVYYTYTCVRQNSAAEEIGDEDESMNIETSFFFYKVKVEYDNPFNDFIKEYNSPDNKSSPVSVLKNGLKIGSTEVFPSFADAFPAFKTGAIFDGNMNLNFLLQTNSRLYTRDGIVERDIAGNKFYLFKTTLNDESGKVEFEYYRANTVGWNVVAIIAGLLVVGALLLFCRYAPKKPKKIYYAQSFQSTASKPADPFGKEYENKSDNDPFNGY